MVSETSGLPGTSIIAAVGRSGTTILHRLLLEIYHTHCGDSFDCLYEPFVWDSALVGHYPRDKTKEAQFGRRDALSEAGLYFHTRTPLFADNTVEPQDDLKAYLKGDNPRPLLAKFIRANGRLSLLDKLYPDGRFILMVRNPFDVVNSVLTKFSFFGAEFHKNDFPRFAEDILRLYGIELGTERDLPSAYKAGLWNHFMNAHAVAHALGKPNYLIIAYEDFALNKEAFARRVCKHVGVPYHDTYSSILERPVGRITQGLPAITEIDGRQLDPLLDEYASLVKRIPQISPFDPHIVRKKYADQTLGRRPKIMRGRGWSPNKLESELAKQEQHLATLAASSRQRMASIQRLTLSAETISTNARPPVSVIVTNFNNATTLRRAVDSILAQTYPAQEIIVADDASTDGSRALIESLSADHVQLRPLLREQNLGVSANRNDAFRNVSNRFACHVDGDDEFHPEKLERETRALQGRMDSVAFSDTIRLEPEDYWDCSWLAGLSGRAAIAGLIARQGPIPRDMLLSVDLFLETGGFREDCSIYEDWGFKVRLAAKARHWLYSGGAGTIYRPGGLSRVDQLHHIYGGLRIISEDVWETIERHRCLSAAFAGLLKLMKIETDPNFFVGEYAENLIGEKVRVILAEMNQRLLSRPVAAYSNREAEFFDTLHRFVSTVGPSLVK